jgi:endonuclease YncB( thermonuclease family)
MALMRDNSRRVCGRLSRWFTASLALVAFVAAAGCTASIPGIGSVPAAPPERTIEAPPTRTSLPMLTAAATSAGFYVEAPTSEATVVEARVVKVVDGDTIHVAVGDRVYSVRYIGIDAPETDSRDARLKRLAADATAVNAGLVANKTVRLERDVSETDDFGRLLRYVWVGDLMVNAELVRLGAARAVTYKPNVKHQMVLSQLQQRAQAAHLGLWSSTLPVAMEGVSLRSGPGTAYAKAGSVEAGQTLDITARNEAGDWVQLASGGWLPARLLSAPPRDVPVADVGRAQQVGPAAPTPVVTPGTGSVEIVEVFRNGTKGPAEPDEYVEIQNLGSEPQLMTGWRLESERRQGDDGQVFHFPDGFVLQPGQKCRIYTNEDHPESCGLSFRHAGSAIWHNTQPDAALLFDPAGNLVSRRQ